VLVCWCHREDAVLQAILKRAYATFKLFNGRFTDLAATVGLEVIRKKLSLFMHFFLPTVKFNQLPFYTDIHGTHLLFISWLCARLCYSSID
jgi:hypothetical protein